jgi:hypothetical protein
MRRFPAPAVSFVCVLIVGSGFLWAHHSFSEFYFERESVTLEGEVAEFEFRNPHAWLHFVVEAGDGTTIRYSAEWSNPNSLRRTGVVADTVSAGDLVLVTGSPGRDPEAHTLHLKGIERPSDGWEWAERGGRGGGRGNRGGRRGRR